jgi:hypothetical protein
MIIMMPTTNLTLLRFMHLTARYALLLLLAESTPALARAGLALDVVKWTDRSSSANSITSPSFTNTAANELLLAFVATDATASGVTVTGVTGAGVTWVLVKRTNTQLGTAEIWRAFAPSVLSGATVTASLSQRVAASIFIVTLTGADTTGTSGSGAIGNTASASSASSAPSASLVTSRNGSWVFGVGNDWDNAISRTVAANQTLVHQYLATVGDTYWVQRQTAPTALSGTQVFINDTAPSTDRYNLSIVEVLAAASTTPTYSLAGAISPAASAVGTLVTLNGPVNTTLTVGASATFTFTGLPNGSYTVTPAKAGFTFSPASPTVTINGADVTGVNFTATPVPTWSISGNISPASLGSGTLLTLSGTPSTTTTADNLGNYTFAGLGNGTYMITPTQTGDSFTPANQTVTVNGANLLNVNFSAQALPPPPANFPDLSDIIPEGNISIAGTGANRMFQYTHDTFNGGSGPLEILPVYNAASGNYQGYQHIYRYQSGVWTPVQTNPVAGAFVFDSAHGHFHFPFATYGLYAANPDGSIGAAVALSTKTGFCINDSFIYDPTLPNAGAFGNWGSCSDPTSLRGLSVGAVDEYDQTDEGQAIAIGGLTDGTYWLRAVVDPYNYFLESDKSNNETDVKLTITGSTVTVLQTVRPVLNPPPAVALTAPAAGRISGTVQLTASTSVVGGAGVQFLVDGLPYGNVVATTPYVLSWDTSTVVAGAHWLAAQTTDSTGRVGTSPVIFVTVANSTTVPPTVQLTTPQPGDVVSAVITISATAAAQVGIPSVQFFVDNVALGSPVTAPPFTTTWDTQRATAGSHVISATATDLSGLVGNSAPVTVTVDNSHPPQRIGIDVMAVRDTSDLMQTPAFSTTAAAELLVAFVGYDGPSTGPQTATVSGAGLPWLLLKRSNTQHGTSEIWAARATDFLTSVTVMAQPGVAGFHGSLTVLAFTNAAGAGIVGQASAPSGAPDIYLPGVFAGNWVFAVGNDWDQSVARTPVSGQSLIHQRLDTQTGDTYWVQATTAPSTADALVDIHDSAPTNDQWNYAAVEIVATRQ